MKPTDKRFEQDSGIGVGHNSEQVQTGGKRTTPQTLELNMISSAFSELDKQGMTDLDRQEFRERLERRLEIVDLTLASRFRTFLDSRFANSPGWAAKAAVCIVLLLAVISLLIYSLLSESVSQPSLAFLLEVLPALA